MQQKNQGNNSVWKPFLLRLATVPVWFLLNGNWFLGFFSYLMFIRFRAGHSRPRPRCRTCTTLLEDVMYKSIILWRHSVNMIPRKVTLLRVHQKEIRADKEFIRLSTLALQVISTRVLPQCVAHEMSSLKSWGLGNFSYKRQTDSTLANLNFF